MNTSAADLPDRETMDVDVVIVGAGPAGLATAIRLKQRNPEAHVVVIEKGTQIGAHIVSGAVVDPVGIDALLPDWRNGQHPFRTRVSRDDFSLLTPRGRIPVPGFLLPPAMRNHRSFIVSLGEVCQWLAGKAEGLGVEVYPGFAATELLRDANGTVTGIATADMGLGKDGLPGPSFARGMELRGRYTVLAEGTRGSLSRMAIDGFGLANNASPQKYGLGFKEIWEVDPSHHELGRIEHTLGWPLDRETGGGGFLYHMEGNRIAVGFVVHLDYKNPYLSPFGEFQRFKTHPHIRAMLRGGERISYGARAISEGGWQSVPTLCFPGGVLVGDAAGFVNVPRIKGSHNAVLSGMLAADSIAQAIEQDSKGTALQGYDAAWRTGPIGRDLYPVRNLKPLWSRFGWAGVALGGLDLWINAIFRRSPFGTLAHARADHQTLRPIAKSRQIDYPRPDGAVSFDKLSSVFLTGTNHAEGEPVHLKVKDAGLQRASEFKEYGGPCERYCPAGVYEWLEDEEGPRLQINAENCIHCKTCDIKDPNLNIVWTVPEGGGGPNYSGM